MRMTLATALWLGPILFLAAVPDGAARVDLEQQDPPPAKSSDAGSPAEEPSKGETPRKKPSGRGSSAKKKAERSRTAKKKLERDAGLAMEPGIVCKSIDGFEDYEPLPGASQTSEEKLLVYIRTYGFKVEKVEKGVEGHLSVDGELRKRGQKAILRQKKNLLDYRPRAEFTPERVFLKAEVSLKGLAPGDYDLTITLHDEIAKDSSTSQVIKFKIIPARDPRKESDGQKPKEPDSASH
jgi:hypothetical protein